MKKKLICLILFIVFLLDACKNDSDFSESSKKDNIIELKAKDYIQAAIDKANLIAGINYMQTENGETYFSDLNTAYSYYGKDIKQLRENSEGRILAVMKDGSFYCKNMLITDEYKIKNIVCERDNAYLITEDGHVLSYYPDWDTSKRKDAKYKYNYLKEMEGSENIVIGCGCRSGVVFLSKDGKPYGQSYTGWTGCEIDGWKDAVVMACTQNKDKGTKSIAAIAADGTVYATGDYSEEILSWGDLAYVSMDEELIVGLKKDGTLVYAGNKAEQFSAGNLTGVEAVRVYDGWFIALIDGGFVQARISSFDGEFIYENPDKPINAVSYYMDTDGNIKQVSGNIWKKSPYVPAIKDESFKLIYFHAMGKDTIAWGMESSYVDWETKDMSFQLLDINKDGTDEILIKNQSISHADGYLGFGCIYNGAMRIILVSDYILGYYPEAGIIVTGRTNQGFSSEIYWSYNKGKIERIAYISTDCNNENIISSYFVDKDIELENANENMDNDSEMKEIEEEEFKALLKKYIGDEEQVKIEEDKFVENTKENRKKIILADIFDEKTNDKEAEKKSISELSNPVIKSQDDVAVWDSIYFGNYWKNDTNGDGRADQSDNKEPIRWRILSIEGQSAFLLAEDIIDIGLAEEYFDWIQNFQKEAFDENELAAIQIKEEGNKVFLLSLNDAKKEELGFSEAKELYKKDIPLRKCGITSYAVDLSKGRTLSWWLATEGSEINYYRENGVMKHNSVKTQCYVTDSGEISETRFLGSTMGFRPAIYLDLSDTSLWDYAGTISSEDYIDTEY